MSVIVTAVAFSGLLILTVVATRVIHRLHAQHAEHIALLSNWRLPLKGGPAVISHTRRRGAGASFDAKGQ